MKQRESCRRHARGFWFFFVIRTLMIPCQILVVPQFIEMKAFGWENSYPGLSCGAAN